MKLFLSIVASLLTFVSYYPYIRDILAKKTRPHLYTWTLWSLLNFVLIALLIRGEAGLALVPMVIVTVLCLAVALLSIKYGTKNITFLDKVLALMSFLAYLFWFFADRPILSLLLIITADIFAFVPTVRKTWTEPHTETLSLYVTNTIRFTITLLAVREYTWLSTLWLSVWITISALFAVLIYVRRKQLAL